MSFDDTTIKQLANLSMLKFDDSDLPGIREDLDGILNFISQINDVDISNVADHDSDSTPLREDVVLDSKISDFVLEHAPKRDGRFFVVPKIIE